MSKFVDFNHWLEKQVRDGKITREEVEMGVQKEKKRVRAEGEPVMVQANILQRGRGMNAEQENPITERETHHEEYIAAIGHLIENIVSTLPDHHPTAERALHAGDRVLAAAKEIRWATAELETIISEMRTP